MRINEWHSCFRLSWRVQFAALRLAFHQAYSTVYLECHFSPEGKGRDLALIPLNPFPASRSICQRMVDVDDPTQRFSMDGGIAWKRGTKPSKPHRMKRFLPSLLLCLFVSAFAHAQVTQLVSNKGLEFVAPLGNNKVLLLETGLKKLWVSDGTATGTFPLSNTLQVEDAGGLLNGQYIFAAHSADRGVELWTTDGTIAGTQLVKDIYPGPIGSEPEDDFALLNGYLYFSAATPEYGRELWRTNGTEAGTTMVKDIIAGPAGSALKGQYEIGSAGTYLLFKAATAADGYELWRSDGTETGTFLLKDINPGVASSDPTAYHVYNGTVLFWATRAAEGRELWRTNGTAAGTSLVKDIRPGAASSINTGFPMLNSTILLPFNNRLLFVADDGASGHEIWTTDGTEAGTYLLKDINPGAEGAFYSLNGPTASLFLSVVLNGKLYFTAYQQSTGAELWETDGTPGGTKLFKEILPGMSGGIPFLMPNFRFTDLNSFPVHQGPQFYFLFGHPNDEGVELWKSNGTEGGTVKVKVIKDTLSDFGNGSYVYANNGFFFSVDDGVHGDELWKSDGSEAGTMLVKDINPNTETDEEGNTVGEGSDISFLPFPVNNFILFTATDGDNEFAGDLFRLDGVFAPLPVKLKEFTVALAGADGQLRWQTAGEQNTLDFLVERSNDGSRFASIGSVAAAGESTAARSYAFTDNGVGNTGKAMVYYRLRMRDKDGKETLSKVVSLNLKGSAGFTVQLLGNPVQSDLRLSFGNVAGPVNLSIKDASGRTVKALQVKTENNLITVPAGHLSPGAYFVTAESGGKSSVVKFLKQ